MIGHLGARVSALLDGRMSAEEEERAWAHVHDCHHCRDQVEREGWVKTRLAQLGLGVGEAPSALKGSLLLAPALLPPGEAYLVTSRSRSRTAVVALGSGAVGVAMLGVLLIGTSPASAPAGERRTPATSLDGPRSGPRPTPEAAEHPGRERNRRQPVVASARR